MTAHELCTEIDARTYTLKRRAEQQAETRRRIVKAAVDLHGTVGPAQTTFSMVAERAGVQRHTLYAHFPDEWSLLMACSGYVDERDPLPDRRAVAGASRSAARGSRRDFERSTTGTSATRRSRLRPARRRASRADAQDCRPAIRSVGGKVERGSGGGPERRRAGYAAARPELSHLANADPRLRRWTRRRPSPRWPGLSTAPAKT